MADDLKNDLREKVLAAFQVEYREQLEGIRTLLAELEAAPQTCDMSRLDEAFRLAHSLKGGARVCDLRTVELFGHRLEELFARVRSGTAALDPPVLKSISQSLDAIEDWMTAYAQNEDPPDTTSAMAAVESLLRSTVPTGAEATKREPAESEPATDRQTSVALSADTVRVSAASLDRLLQSAGSLLAECLDHDQVTRDLSAMQSELLELEREHETFRRAAASNSGRNIVIAESDRVERHLEAAHRRIHKLSRSVGQLYIKHRRLAWQLQSRGRSIQQEARDARMVPAGTILQGLRKMVRDLANDEHKQIELRVNGFDVRADRLVLQALKDPLMHVLRNCIGHGIEAPDERRRAGKPAEGRVAVTAEAADNELLIVVEDDGRGIDLKQVAATAVRRGLLSESQAEQQSAEELHELLFHAGFSTSVEATDLAGRGMGLSVVRESARRLQGDAHLESTSGVGARLDIRVPLSLSTHRLLVVSSGGRKFAVPTRNITKLMRITADNIESIEGRAIVRFQGTPLPLEELADLLGIESRGPNAGDGSRLAVLIRAGGQSLALGVDACESERELLILNLTGPAAADDFSGAVLLDDGAIALVVNPGVLVKSPRPVRRDTSPVGTPMNSPSRSSRILVVDDSFTTRALEKSLLEAHGYEVKIAVDGVDALTQLRNHDIDVVISDIEMPRKDGFELLTDLKKDDRLSSLPVVLVTSRDRPEDRRRGLELGADAYIVKSQFDHEELLDTIRQIIGPLQGPFAKCNTALFAKDRSTA